MEESETIASAPPPPPDPGETQNLPPMSYHHNVENNDFQQLNRALFQLQPHAILSQTLPTRYGHSSLIIMTYEYIVSFLYFLLLFIQRLI